MTIQALALFQNEPHKKLTCLFFPSFTGCVAISGPVTGSSLKIYMTYVAFEPADVNSVGLVRVLNIPFWTTGTKCVTVRTGNTVRNINENLNQKCKVFPNQLGAVWDECSRPIFTNDCH